MTTVIDSYCGLDCSGCGFKDSHGCGGCLASDGRPFHGRCDVADCAKTKHVRFCGDCAEFPCETLNRYSHDPEHGDQGARIERCRRLKA